MEEYVFVFILIDLLLQFIVPLLGNKNKNGIRAMKDLITALQIPQETLSQFILKDIDAVISAGPSKSSDFLLFFKFDQFFS